MSTWRRQASTRLPELQRLIAAREVDTPMMLWIELMMKFQTLCAADPLPLDLLRRIWAYCEWCLAHPSDSVSTAAALAFCEHLIDTPATRRALPLLMSRATFEGLKNLILCHHTEADFQSAAALFTPDAFQIQKP